MNRIETSQQLNTIQGIIITGGVGQMSSQVLTFIKANNMYPILKYQSEGGGDSSTTRYEIQVDHDKLNNLNKKVVELLGIKQQLVIAAYADQTEKLSLWVNNRSEKIVKMTYTGREIANNRSTDKTITFDYPTNLSVEIPNDPKRLSS